MSQQIRCCPYSCVDSEIFVKGGPRSSGVVNNTSADQPAHPGRQISADVIRFVESIKSKLATSEISSF